MLDKKSAWNNIWVLEQRFHKEIISILVISFEKLKIP